MVVAACHLHSRSAQECASVSLLAFNHTMHKFDSQPDFYFYDIFHSEKWLWAVYFEPPLHLVTSYPMSFAVTMLSTVSLTTLHPFGSASLHSQKFPTECPLCVNSIDYYEFLWSSHIATIVLRCIEKLSIINYQVNRFLTNKQPKRKFIMIKMTLFPSPSSPFHLSYRARSLSVYHCVVFFGNHSEITQKYPEIEKCAVCILLRLYQIYDGPHDNRQRPFT